MAIMLYDFDIFILDDHNKTLVLKSNQQLITQNDRHIATLALLAKAYPNTLGKSELMEKLWPNTVVTEWAISRLISDLRQLLSSHAPDLVFIKTVHGTGFRLGFECPPITEDFYFAPQKNAPASTSVRGEEKVNIWTSRKPIIAFVILLIVLLASYSLIPKNTNNSWKSSEQVKEAFFYVTPTASWWSSTKDSVRHEGEFVFLEARENGQRFSFIFREKALLQNATIALWLQVDDEFVRSKTAIQLFAQVMERGNWIGEWSCPAVLPDNENANHFKLECTITTHSEFWKQEKNEASHFGIILVGESPSGTLSVKSASVFFPVSINTDSGWSNNPVYGRGVLYNPKFTNDSLHRSFKGPLDLRGASVIYSIRVDNKFIESGASLQPYLFKVGEHIGMWDCLIFNSDLHTSGFNVQCSTIPDQEEFLLHDDDNLIIGIQPFGDKVEGSVKIIGISIISPNDPEI